MNMGRFFAAVVLTVVLGGATLAQAEPTDITIRVLSKDAKFIGTSMGGMRVTLSDAETGEVLAQGLTEGGTGNTKLLMHDSGGRRAPMADDSAAKFAATLDLDTPRLIRAEAYGPLGHPASAHEVTATQWVVPGRDLTGGDGWVLELPGFVVELQSPQTPIVASSSGKSIALKAKVTMMCGCPITPGGLWDADGYEVTGLLYKDGKKVDSAALSYAGETSLFAGDMATPRPGRYELVVYAYDPANGNTGVAKTALVVGE
ncbi:hypothetical protein [uncultured Parvibaculum sp.]|uniref:hypothetical protein n=2 Tax=Parvibaculum TaxID=256616 RepID=UPI0030DB7CD7